MYISSNWMSNDIEKKTSTESYFWGSAVCYQCVLYRWLCASFTKSILHYIVLQTYYVLFANLWQLSQHHCSFIMIREGEETTLYLMMMCWIIAKLQFLSAHAPHYVFLCEIAAAKHRKEWKITVLSATECYEETGVLGLVEEVKKELSRKGGKIRNTTTIATTHAGNWMKMHNTAQKGIARRAAPLPQQPPSSGFLW